MRPLAAAALTLLGAWLLLRRRAAEEQRVVVAWEDGSELELREGSEERDRLVAVARAAIG